MASIMTVSNEMKTSTSRVTKEGRHLTYEMEVIQKPERARACGSGAKCTSQCDGRCRNSGTDTEQHLQIAVRSTLRL